METRDPLPAGKPVEPAPLSTTTSKVTEVRTGLVALQVPVTEFPVDVMGEARYQHVLEKICGGRTPDGVDLVLPARCVPDEADGVRVEIHGAPVGSLTSDAAWVYRMTIHGASECRARIRGGWDRGLNDLGHFGMRLDLVLPEVGPELAALRRLRALVYSRAIIGESNHQPALRQIMARRTAEYPAWEPFFMARLVREDAGSVSVRVEIEGMPVGHLGRVDARRHWTSRNAPPEVPACITSIDGADGRTRYSVDLSLDRWMRQDPEK